MEGDYNHFDQLFQEIDTKVQQTVKAAAFHIEAGAKQRAAVDTGFMRNSVYTKTEDGGGSPVSGDKAFPDVETPEHNEAIVAVGATYAIFLEYGTRHMGAQPFLTPAVEAERQPFLTAIKAIEGLGD